MHSTETCTILYAYSSALANLAPRLLQVHNLRSTPFSCIIPEYNYRSTDHSQGIFRVPGRNKDQEPEACVPTTRLLTAAPGLADFATASGADDGLVESELPFSLFVCRHVRPRLRVDDPMNQRPVAVEPESESAYSE
jgi:hypothetical protein